MPGLKVVNTMSGRNNEANNKHVEPRREPIMIINTSSIEEDISLYLTKRDTISKNKWNSQCVAKQCRNRQSKSNRVNRHHRQKRYYHNSHKAHRGTISNNLVKNKSHKHRLASDSLVNDMVDDMNDNEQCILESILAENIDNGINDEITLDKDLLILDSPKRRRRRKKMKKYYANDSNYNSFISDKSDTYTIGGMSDISSIGSTASPSHKSVNYKHLYKYESLIKYDDYADSSVAMPQGFLDDLDSSSSDDDSSSEESDSSVSDSESSSADFISTYYKNNISNASDTEEEEQTAVNAVAPVPVAPVPAVPAAPKEEEKLDFDIENELKLLGFKDSSGETGAADEMKESKEDMVTLEGKYVESISEIDELNHYGPITGLAERSSYKEFNKDDETTKMDPKMLKKVFSEIRTDLPKNIVIQWNGSMFIRFDEENPRFLQALLTGLEDTPYHNGLFLFDIYLHKDYPNTALNIKHVTKGATLVQAHHSPGGFSPNLHRSSGKVCLSLLGTWGTNQWDPKTSNIYQVLSSILFCIFGAQWAYYMEPDFGGWEGTCNMDESDPSKHEPDVIEYNYEIIEKNMKYAMLETISQPYKGFEEVIKTHFKLKKNEILKNILTKWIPNAPKIEKKKKLVALYKSIKDEINKLETNATETKDTKDTVDTTVAKDTKDPLDAALDAIDDETDESSD